MSAASALTLFSLLYASRAGSSVMVHMRSSSCQCSSRVIQALSASGNCFSRSAQALLDDIELQLLADQ
jgi:hypothetical protein